MESSPIETLAGEAWNAYPDNELIAREKHMIIAAYAQSGAEAIAHLLWQHAAVFHDAPSRPYMEVGRWMDSVAGAIRQNLQKEPVMLRIAGSEAA